MLELPKFLNLEEIIEKAKRREILSQRELRDILSRTFGPNTDLLAFSKAKNESQDKARYVTNLNNNARFADTIEDSYLKRPAKVELNTKLEFIYNRMDLSDTNIEDLINNDLKEITKKMIKGAMNEREKLFIEQFENGNTLRELRSFKPSIRNSIVTCMNKMINGMGVYLTRGKLETVLDLRNYCFFVAGTVGDTLNRIVAIEDGETLNYDNARAISAYFQLTNIMKNLREDFELREHRTKFVPDELHAGIDYEDLFNKKTNGAKKEREKVLGELLAIAAEYFVPSCNYVFTEIHPKLSGYTAFCGVPLITARETQKLIETSGSEKVFRGDKDAVKIDREKFTNILSFVYNTVRLDGGIRFKAWGIEYQKDPHRFSFKPGEYEAWSGELLKP